MVEEIAKITPQPITHVVVCSDHGDHTAGNGAFPAGATFYAHPTSKAVLEASAGRSGRGGDNLPVPVPSQVVTDKTVLKLGGTRNPAALPRPRAHGRRSERVSCPRNASSL